MRIHGVELHSNEEVVKVIRQQRIRLTPQFVLAFILLATPFYYIGPLFSVRWIGMPFFFFCIFTGLLFAGRVWVRYRGTMLIISNQRVVDVGRRGFFDTAVSEVPYESLSNVSYRARGIWETLTGAGTVNFQMIGGQDNIAFRHAGNPSAVQKIVMELRIAHARGTPTVADPVEDMMNNMQTLSPTEQRALLVSMKQTVKKKRPLNPSP